MTPKKAIESLETVEDALEQLAPGEVFGGIKLVDYKTQVQKSRTVRQEMVDIENQKTNKANERDTTDGDGLKMRELIVNGVIGNPNYGPDSSLYEAMGFVRKSERKSGLTRKKKGTNGNGNT
jgi:hypothetical protein